ncbi:cutinase transcription factor 1 alpha, partial [Penicillium samsonianum]|uniref:cutinase transcription factor 1 alpha n=1 Tax=Penicillium samsonianum TaxID=1882272 RepID=UPI002548E172
VRCDVATHGVPCTNCFAFQVRCCIPTPKPRKTQNANGQIKGNSDRDCHGVDHQSQQQASNHPISCPSWGRPLYHTTNGTPSTSQTEAQALTEQVDNGTLLRLVMRPKFTRASITDAGRVVYQGESGNVTFLIQGYQGGANVHYPHPENIGKPGTKLNKLDKFEMDILHQRGAFLLPPRSLCDRIIDAYFKWVHPTVPAINRTRFMKQYRDPKNPPSVLLLHAILLAGSRFCNDEADGLVVPDAQIFYNRAKALYDANYEDDRVTIIQSALLMGWYWEAPEDVTKNAFYWSRVATVIAQGCGMHRTVEQSHLRKSYKRLWKRIWWTLFTLDRSIAVALGRPTNIDLQNCDVEMLTEDDFVEEDADGVDRLNVFSPNPVHVQFFLQYVKLCGIMGIVLAQNYPVVSKEQRNPTAGLTTCSDTALTEWLRDCPQIVYWEAPRHHFWAAILHSHYYTTLCLLHRVPPTLGDSAHSRNTSSQAAAMITCIVEILASSDQLRYSPSSIVHSLFSALIIHINEISTSVSTIRHGVTDRLRSCMSALKEVSHVWVTGKMAYILFESIIRNNSPEDGVQIAGLEKREMHQNLFQLKQQATEKDASKQGERIRHNLVTASPRELASYRRSQPHIPSTITKRNDGSRQDHNTISQMAPSDVRPGMHGQVGDWPQQDSGSRAGRIQIGAHQGPYTTWLPGLDVEMPDGPCPDSWGVTQGEPAPITLDLNDW